MVAGTWGHSALDSTEEVGIWHMSGFQNKTQMRNLEKDLHSSHGGIMGSKHWIPENILPLLTTSSLEFHIVVECYYLQVRKTL